MRDIEIDTQIRANEENWYWYYRKMALQYIEQKKVLKALSYLKKSWNVLKSFEL